VPDQALPRPAAVHLILADPWSKEWGQPHPKDVGGFLLNLKTTASLHERANGQHTRTRSEQCALSVCRAGRLHQNNQHHALSFAYDSYLRHQLHSLW